MAKIEEGVLNIKCTHKHCDLEAEIKRLDPNQDKTRPALLKRFLDAAEGKTDWMSSYYLLAEIEHDPNAVQFNSWQAKYDSETGDKLASVRQNMEKSLKEGKVITKVLQYQFMLLLLMVNYRETLKKTLLTVKADKQVNEDISLPEMAALFTELILVDKNSDALKEIRKTLINWRNR